MNATGWSHGLEVAGSGTGVVSHAWLVLLRELADRTGPDRPDGRAVGGAAVAGGRS